MQINNSNKMAGNKVLTLKKNLEKNSYLLMFLKRKGKKSHSPDTKSAIWIEIRLADIAE